MFYLDVSRSRSVRNCTVRHRSTWSSRPAMGRSHPEAHVPRFGRRKIPHVFTAIAASILALASCFAAPIPAQAAQLLSLVILPDQGESAIYDFVNSATNSIDVTIYELRDTTSGQRPVAKQKRRGNVPVIFDSQHASIDGAGLQRADRWRSGRGLSSTSIRLHPPEDDHRRRHVVLHQHRQLRHDVLLDLPGLRRLRHDTTDVSAIRRCSTPTTRTPRSPRPTAPTWSGRRPPTRRRSSAP